MNLGSLLRGVYHAITPWHDSGSVFSSSSYQPKKKVLQPGDPGYQAPAPSVQAPQQPQVKAQTPQNLFAGLNNNLRLPGSPQNNISVVHAPNLTHILPQPGTVVQPTQQTQPKPQVQPQSHTSLLQHIGNALKTAGQTALGTAANVPEVGLAAGRAATGIVQGAGHLPSLATHALTYVPRKIAGDDSAINRGLSTINRGVDTATHFTVDNALDPINRNLDAAAKGYAAHVPQAAAGAQVYRREQVPLNVLAGLLTLGGSTASQGYRLGEANPGRVTQLLNKPLISNTDNIVSRTGRAVSSKAAPVVHTLNTPIKSARGGITRLVNGRTVPDTVDAGEIGNLLSDAQVQDLTQAPTQIPVTQTGGGDVPIPVGVPRPGPPIREIGGDKTPGKVQIPTTAEAAAQRAADQFNGQAPARPDQGIEGVTTDPSRIITKSDKADYQTVLDDKLRTGQITESEHKDLSDQLKKVVAANEPVPKGAKIEVKQVNNIPVTDQTVVPTNLPETPGTVRATTATALNNAKSKAVAETQQVYTEASQSNIPVVADTANEYILKNPKQFNKRQVAAARNQRKLAKQLAKTKADTQAVIHNSPELAPKPDSGNPGFVPTGEVQRGVNGNVSEVAHRDTEAAQAASDTANLSSGDVLAKAQQEVTQGGRVSPESVRNLQAMLESGRFSQTSPEYQAMAKTLYGAGSDYGRGLSLFNPALRRTATGDQLTNRFVSKLYGVAEDGSKLTDAHIAAVSQAENQFTAARDAANQALDRYNATKSAADFTAWKQAVQTAEDAEKQSLITEYKVADQVLKGNKDPNALKAVQEAEKKAGVYQMDWIDANMLSGTGTAARNYVNTGLVRLENALFGRIGGGYSGKGAKLGNQVGNRSVVTDFNARNHLDQNVLSKSIKQWSTTANTLGEGNIKAVGSARAYKYYENQLKSEGVTGDQLARDTEVRLHSDPDGMAQHYQEWALRENALSGLAHSKKFEQQMVEWLAGNGHGKLAQTSAKAIVRLTVGFPTVIGRSLVGGAKRATVGLPELASAGVKLARGDKQAAVDALYDAKVHAGSGAALYGLGTVLAKAGIITPSYPSDPAERAKWKADGTQPNSIRIGGQWFNIPGYFGALALPLTIPANVINKTSPADVAKGVITGISDLSPVNSIQSFVDGMEGRGGKQWVKNEVTSLTRAVTPVGSLLNEIAKMADPTKNDTTTKDAIHNLLDSIASGIPGVNNAVNKIPATDDNGNILHNPNPVATFFGAQGSEQSKGIEDTQQAQSTANDTYKQLSDSGVIGNKSLMGLVDKKIQAQIARGQDLTPEQITSVQKAVSKGISSSIKADADSNWRENGDYATDKAATQVKLQLLNADPTAKNSDKANLKTQIARDDVLEKNKVPYTDLQTYQHTSLSDWRNMGDPTSDTYDPATYQKLWEIDQAMTKAGGSYNTDPTKNKFSAKKPGKGSGSSKAFSGDFGTLKAGNFAPSVQQYATIDTKSGAIPHISVVRPNIVHKISAGGGI